MPVPVNLFAGLAPLISTERRSSVDMKPHDTKMTSVDQYGRSDSILTHINSSSGPIGTTPVTHCTTSGTCTNIHPEPVPNSFDPDPNGSDRDYNSLNTSFGNIQIDLDNLGAILGSTSITVCKPVVPTSGSTTQTRPGTTPTSMGDPSTQLKQNIENEPSDYR